STRCWRPGARACRRLCLASRAPSCLLFFFQAEDGIRAFHVTGVQTCALPISDAITLTEEMRRRVEDFGWDFAYALSPGFENNERSEERRVGKECITRWSPYPSKETSDYCRAQAWSGASNALVTAHETCVSRRF